MGICGVHFMAILLLINFSVFALCSRCCCCCSCCCSRCCCRCRLLHAVNDSACCPVDMIITFMYFNNCAWFERFSVLSISRAAFSASPSSLPHGPLFRLPPSPFLCLSLSLFHLFRGRVPPLSDHNFCGSITFRCKSNWSLLTILHTFFIKYFSFQLPPETALSLSQPQSPPSPSLCLLSLALPLNSLLWLVILRIHLFRPSLSVCLAISISNVLRPQPFPLPSSLLIFSFHSLGPCTTLSASVVCKWVFIELKRYFCLPYCSWIIVYWLRSALGLADYRMRYAA